MGDALTRAVRLADQLVEALRVFWLWLPVPLSFFRGGQPSPLIVSMTSYPARIQKAWISIETLLRQSMAPSRLILFLAVEDFPDQKLPRMICRQQKRGLEVMWTSPDGRSFDKLLPAIKLFPDSPIVTVDDDKYFPRNLLAQLVEGSAQAPGAIVGARGWIIHLRASVPTYGDNWTRAKHGDTGPKLLMPGGNGCLYPPHSLHRAAHALDDALRICPTADDIWFWAAATKNESPMLCLGMPPHRPVDAQAKTESLAAKNKDANSEQFRAAIQHFAIDTDRIIG